MGMPGYSLSDAPVPVEALYADHIARLQDAYAQALDAAGFDALLIHAGRAQAQSPFDDQFWPHKPTPAFSHWLPLLRADAALLVQPGKRPTLFEPVAADYWESEPEPESEHFRNAFDVIEIASQADIGPRLPARVAFVGNDRNPADGWNIAAEAINPAPLMAALDLARAHKTDYERCCMGEANRRAARGHQAVLDAFAGGDHSELELNLLYLQVTAQDDWQIPYKNIVAMNRNAAVLHHVRYRRQPPAGQARSLLLDAGATCMGYASDITRTAVKGEGASLFAELIRRIEALQAAVIQRIEPGLAFEDLHDHAHQLLAPILRDLGIASASEDELVASGATRHFLPHGLGHSLGIQVHDVGCRPREPRSDNPFLRNTSIIEPGQVFTIEPGCYFIQGLLDALRQKPVAATIDWASVDLLARFGGVRIEDDIAVVEGGTSNLTRDNWPPTP
jgi:Xaa-Pro dipeptidase